MEDRRYAFINRDPLSETLKRERNLRKTDALWQCKCDIGMPFMPPVGQQLRYLNGHKRVPGIQLLPLKLMNTEQIEHYSTIAGVRCWWDGNLFDGHPVGCPIKICKVREKLDKPIVHKRYAWHWKDDKNSKPKKFRGLKYPGTKLNAMVPIHLRNDYTKPTDMKFMKTEYFHTQTHKRVDGYLLHGYFCSWACARAYGQQFIPRLRFNIGSWIYKIIIEITNSWKEEGLVPKDYHVRPIAAAPHFSVLKDYGGFMSIEQFRRINEQDNLKKLTIIPSWSHIIPTGMLATEMPVQNMKFSTRYNEQMSEFVVKPHRPKQITKFSSIKPIKMVRKRRNAILDCIKG